MKAVIIKIYKDFYKSTRRKHNWENAINRHFQKGKIKYLKMDEGMLKLISYDKNAGKNKQTRIYNFTYSI